MKMKSSLRIQLTNPLMQSTYIFRIMHLFMSSVQFLFPRLIVQFVYGFRFCSYARIRFYIKQCVFVYESVRLSKHVSASTAVYETRIHFTYTLSLFMYSACVSVSALVLVNTQTCLPSLYLSRVLYLYRFSVYLFLYPLKYFCIPFLNANQFMC